VIARKCLEEMKKGWSRRKRGENWKKEREVFLRSRRVRKREKKKYMAKYRREIERALKRGLGEYRRKYNKCYKIMQEEEVSDYLEKVRREEGWRRVARFRIGNEMKKD